MKPDLRSYFEPIERLLGKVLKIEQFQRMHRSNLYKHYTSTASKGQMTQEKWEKRVLDLKKEIHLLRNRLSTRTDPMKPSRSSSVDDFSSFRQPTSVYASTQDRRHQVASSSTSTSQLHYSTFNKPVQLDPVTPMVHGRNTSFETPRSGGSSKITLRSGSSISAFRAHH